MRIEDLLANCEKEQLHLTGKIQNFGALLRIDDKTLNVTHVSENCALFCGESPESLLGKSVSAISWLHDDDFQALPENAGSRTLLLYREANGIPVHIRLIRGKGFYIVEVEAMPEEKSRASLSELEAMLYPSSGASWNDSDYFDRLLNTLSSLISYERAMLYRFEEDWVGEVVAEHTVNAEILYKNLKFPASDIPEIARKMYFENPSRLIAAVAAEPVTVISRENAIPDLTWSDLRSASPVHLEYLKNMGVMSSYSIGLIISGKLWGIVACHHPKPIYFDAETRSKAEALVKQFCSVYKTYKARQRVRQLGEADNKVHDMLLLCLGERASSVACANLAFWLKQNFYCTTVAIVINGQWYQNGELIDESTLNKLDRYLSRDVSNHIFHTQNMSSEQDDEALATASTRGVMAIRLSYEKQALRCYILRPPEAQHTYWAGNPKKASQQASNTGALSPRSSFEKWTQVRGNESRPWTVEDQLLVKKLRAVLLKNIKAFSG
ncbi:GAF domain-containing protein [Alteromonas pelagimontana]|uniref:GAF domain-containing protein n=1 Tax=Alteromonas pelagimontana TaxID=1858656 RepID=A0A6M4MB00_9ALTE|nr:GAF domain-containing protein [Alteromonas pelagimontana]QJR80374.1 GAF domain-containing protein [Alteromonas pelagimontana]